MLIAIILSNVIAISTYFLTIDKFNILQELAICSIIFSICISIAIIKSKNTSNKIKNISRTIYISFFAIFISLAAISLYNLNFANQNSLIKKENLVNKKVSGQILGRQNIENLSLQPSTKNNNHNILIQKFSYFIIIFCILICVISLTNKKENNELL